MVVLMVIVGAVVIGLIVAVLRYKKIGIFAKGILLNYKLLLIHSQNIILLFFA